MLCEEDHSEVIAARMKQRAAQQHRQYIRETKREALRNFLSSLDSVLPEVLQERQLFGKEVSNTLKAYLIDVLSAYTYSCSEHMHICWL
jgi:vacuolar-type H+-ATPase subunit E/Vma4